MVPCNTVKDFLGAITTQKPVTADPLAGSLVMIFGGLVNFLGRHEPTHGVWGAVACFSDFVNGAVCDVLAPIES